VNSATWLLANSCRKFRFLHAAKKSDAELNFFENRDLLREKPTIPAFLKYRLSSALLKTRSDI
jgi:hypothetical protein